MIAAEPCLVGLEVCFGMSGGFSKVAGGESG